MREGPRQHPGALRSKRLQTPLRRTNPKGTGQSQWEPITWDEAYDAIVSEFNRVKEEDGPDAVMFYCGDPKEPRGAMQRLATLFGSPTYGTESSTCAAATWICSQLVTGQLTMGSDPTDATASCLVWSLNPAWSQPYRFGDMMKQKERGCKFVVVDPRITPTVTGLADVHLQLRPGTDGALALAWTNVIIEKKLYDELYTKKWTNAPFLVCEDMEPSGFPTVRTDGSYWDVKTRLLKESDIKEGGSPYKFLVYDNNWEKLKAEGVEHEYGAFTWFNADQEGVIDETGGFWEGENYDSEKAREGREASQDNLLPGQTQGWIPDPMPFDPAIDPALEGEFEITLKDGKTVKVKPVWEYYKARAAEYKPEVAAEITGIPASEIEAAATAYGTRIDPSMAADVQAIVDETDNRPMRVLGYRTPAEAFTDELLELTNEQGRCTSK